MQIDTMRMCFNTSNDMQASPTEDTNPYPPFFPLLHRSRRPNN
jgi:hypothetical protein